MEEALRAFCSRLHERHYSKDGLSSPILTGYPTGGYKQAQLDSEEILEDMNFTKHSGLCSSHQVFHQQLSKEAF